MKIIIISYKNSTERHRWTFTVLARAGHTTVSLDSWETERRASCWNEWQPSGQEGARWERSGKPDDHSRRPTPPPHVVAALKKTAERAARRR